MSIALARKYRPKRFADVAVQSHVSATLKGAIARGRVAHGYLLCGPRGTGKTTLARVLAMALNCERRIAAAQRLEQLEGGKGAGGGAAGDADEQKDLLTREASEPCGECASCRRIWSGSASLDVVEIDAASNRGVDDARELRERAMYAPSAEQGYKVYIVDEAHMLTREAWNALLKILEEPPPRVVFVFATTEPQKIMQAAAPVLSRVQRFDLKRIGPGEIRERLAHVLASERVAAEPEALAAIARAADGSMRDALSLTDQVLSMGEGDVTADRVREALGLVPEDEFITLLDLLAERRAADVFPAVSRLAEAGIDFGQFLTGFADVLRAQLAMVLGGQAPDVSERAREALEVRKDRFAAADLLRMLQTVGELEPRFRKSGQQQLLIETMLVRFALLDRAVELEEVLRSLESGRSGERATGRSGEAGDPAIGRSGDRPTAATKAAGPTPRGDIRSESRSEILSVSRATSAVPAHTDPLSHPIVQSLNRPIAPSPDLNQIVGRWDDLVDRVRTSGKPMLASALEHASPVAAAANGVVTIELDEPNDIFAHSITTARAELTSMLRDWFAGIERIELRRDHTTPAAPPKRLTDEDLRAQRIAALKKRDAILSAAIDALDLDVAD